MDKNINRIAVTACLLAAMLNAFSGKTDWVIVLVGLAILNQMIILSPNA